MIKPMKLKRLLLGVMFLIVAGCCTTQPLIVEGMPEKKIAPTDNDVKIMSDKLYSQLLEHNCTVSLYRGEDLIKECLKND